jgi:hypothetical protein
MPRLGLAMPDRRKKGKNLDCLTTRSQLTFRKYVYSLFFVVECKNARNSNMWLHNV